MTSFVPTPSADDARIGFLDFFVSSRNSPAKPPRSPTTSLRQVRDTFDLSSSTACSPASIETPASAYVTVRLRVVLPAPALHGCRAASERSLTYVTASLLWCCVLPTSCRTPSSLSPANPVRC